MVFRIIDHYNSEKSLHLYHIRYCGQDSNYDAFYEKFRSVEILHSHFDQPHDYFVYMNETDRLAMVEAFGAFIVVEPTEETWESQFPSAPPLTGIDKEINDILFETLFGEIREEINREIIAKLRSF